MGPMLVKPNSDVTTVDHKVNAVRGILSDYKHADVILVGDNGEHDPEVYEIIEKQFPMRNITTYVHYISAPDNGNVKLRGKPLAKNQTAYITSADLAYHFYQNGLITEKSFEQIQERVLNFLKDSERRFWVLPKWVNCRGISLANELNSVSEKMTQIMNVLSERCELGHFRK